MQSDQFIKCPCQKCGGHIEFPSTGVGEIATCPHCGAETKLFFAAGLSTPETKKPQKNKTLPILGVCIGLVVLGAIGWFVWKRKSAAPPALEPVIETKTNVPAALAKKTNAPPVPVLQEWDGLKSSGVTVEKSTDSRLIYAVGSIRNESDRERFGVKVTLDLLDENGEKVGSATDYVQSIQPGKTWKFKALVTETRTAKAKITAVKEN